MRLTKLHISAAVLAPVVLAAMGAVLAIRSALGDSGPEAKQTDLGRLPPDTAQMYALVKKPYPGELGWQQMPWLVDLADGMRRAKEEDRPLLLFVSGDELLEKG